jgi:transposase
MDKDSELERLRQENKTLRQENEGLRQENQVLREGLRQAIQAIECLQEQMKALEGKQAKDSHNSHLPPSSDRFVRPPKSLRQKSGKRPGGQAGHSGHHLKQVDEADEVVLHIVQRCEHCQKDLQEVPATQPECRQVIELPLKRLWITEHRVEEKQCPGCLHLTRAAFPPKVEARVQYGDALAALAVYLVQGQMLPYARASELLQDVLGVQLSAGTIATWISECYEQLAPIEEKIKEALVKEKVIHQDETGLRVGKESYWAHVCSTTSLTHYLAHRSRGREALDQMGIIARFEGTSVHDGYASYPGYACRHGLCNVHHLRELTFLEEHEKQVWARKMKDLLLEMKEAVEQAKAQEKPALDVLALARFSRRYDDVLQEGDLANPPNPPPKKRSGGRPKQSPARNLLDRLISHKWEVLAFLRDFDVPFDNNQAERDLRMLKVQQKISGCFRTQDGAAVFCRIRGYLSTLWKQGIDVLSALQQTLAGHPVLPAF